MKKFLILAVLLTTLFSCSDDDDNTTSQINIRLSNVSEFDFRNIVVNTTTGNTDFENIIPGQ